MDPLPPPPLQEHPDHPLPTADTPVLALLDQFEDRYRREAGDVRTLSCQMQDVLAMTEQILNELDRRPLWKRVWQWVVGYSATLQRQHYRNQVRLQQLNLLLTAAVARQNRIVIEGLRITLEKLERVEADARVLREAVLRSEDRRQRHSARWQALTTRVRNAWHWMCATTRGIFHKSHS